MDFTIKNLQKLSHLKILHIPKGGFFIWLELANYIDEKKFYYKCHLNGLSILPGFIFYPKTKQQFSSKIRISVVNSSFSEIEKGIDIIKNILNNCEAVINENKK